MTSLISIVVPIYHVKDYLTDCFDSLLDQDFDGYTIMAINDGSPYGEQEIIDDYSNKYPGLIHGYTKENGGYGSVLQYAIEHMDTPYFIVCDPDDTLQKDALRTLYDGLTKANADIAVASKYYVYSGSDETTYHPVVNTDYFKINDGDIGVADTITMDPFYFMDPSPHAKLYKTELLKGCEFPTKISYTDNLLYYYGLTRAKRVVYLSKGLSNYLIDRPDNSMSNATKPAAIDANLSVFVSILRQCDHPHNAGMFYYRMFESLKWLFEQISTMDGDSDAKHAKAMSLYSGFKLVCDHYDQIKPYYTKYSKARFFQKYRETSVLSGSYKAYVNWVNHVYPEK